MARTVYACDLELHDMLYFASREMGRLYETERVIHNYALCYALGLVNSPYFTRQQTPTYRRDLEGLNERGIYVTPAAGVEIDFSLNTWKYASNHYHVKMEKTQTNTPSFGRAKEITPESRFRFYIISENDYDPPRWIRLGKWLSKTLLTYQAIESPPIHRGEYVTRHPLNPLDVVNTNSIALCDLLNLPPVSLIDNAHLTGDYFKLAVEGQKEVLLPARMTFNFRIEKGPD
ncbi:MAG: type I-D CRISPR-associated protein Cas5/Csc1 [Blastocatellia bacterium]|nr:type I-D CRISPR-associated protein Cas5/Csc1 [Blastocatellia bacterium]